VGRQIAYDLLSSAPLRDLDRSAVTADLHGLRGLKVDVVVVFVLVELQDAILRQVQKAWRGHLRTIGLSRAVCEVLFVVVFIGRTIARQVGPDRGLRFRT
jgi:hypothetical protein